MFPEKNYVQGSGKIYFAPFMPGTRSVGGNPQEYFGNTPEFNFTTDRETLEHQDADNGLRVTDFSITTSLDRTVSLNVDHISPGNLAKWFLGTNDVFAQAGGTGLSYTLTNARKGGRYQIGRTTVAPQGDRGITVSAVSMDGTPLVNNVDYTVDGATGGITFLPGGTNMPEPTEEGEDVTITYSRVAASYHRVISGNQEIEGELFFRAQNGAGQQFDVFIPYVKISPDGDLPLKSEEWVNMTFALEVLKLDDQTEQVYITGRAGSGL